MILLKQLLHILFYNTGNALVIAKQSNNWNINCILYNLNEIETYIYRQSYNVLKQNRPHIDSGYF